jgi:hypothetical protein
VVLGDGYRVKGKQITDTLSFDCKLEEVRGLGLEPRLTASKADVLPLDDPRYKITNLQPVFAKATTDK